MHEEQQRGKLGVPRGPMEKRPGESVCPSLGQEVLYEMADTAIIMQIHVIYRGGGATGGALNRIIFMIIIAFNHQTGGSWPVRKIAISIIREHKPTVNHNHAAQQRKRSPLLVLPAARPLAELQVFSDRVRGPRTASGATRAAPTESGREESERRSRKVLKVSPWVSPISRKQISPRQPGPP